MQNIIEMKIMSRGMNNNMTNIMNAHTCAISCNNLIGSIVLLSSG
jgi:hypothetical protein